MEDSNLKKSKFPSGLPSLDREIVLTLEDREMLNLCITNRYMRNTVCNEKFWQTRTHQKLPGVVKPVGMTWKQFYLSQLQ